MDAINRRESIDKLKGHVCTKIMQVPVRCRRRGLSAGFARGDAFWPQATGQVTMTQRSMG